ncbi:MAG: hypothetical protein R2867_31050 [Caldilineaceae bacterium]
MIRVKVENEENTKNNETVGWISSNRCGRALALEQWLASRVPNTAESTPTDFDIFWQAWGLDQENFVDREILDSKIDL